MSVTIKLLRDEIISRNELLSLKVKAVLLHDLRTDGGVEWRYSSSLLNLSSRWK
jgi:hypothetical protein